MVTRAALSLPILASVWRRSCRRALLPWSNLLFRGRRCPFTWRPCPHSPAHRRRCRPSLIALNPSALPRPPRPTPRSVPWLPCATSSLHPRSGSNGTPCSRSPPRAVSALSDALLPAARRYAPTSCSAAHLLLAADTRDRPPPPTGEGKRQRCQRHADHVADIWVDVPLPVTNHEPQQFPVSHR